MTPLLKVESLHKHFTDARGLKVRAVNGVSFSLAEGEVLGVVGESGCGKTTLGRTLARLSAPTSGTIQFEGRDLASLGRRDLRQARRHLQMVFQDPFGSLNPRHKVGTIIAEPLVVHGLGERQKRVAELLELVGLPAEAARRFPHEFSGGQRQRIAIARALALEPKLLIADEPVSALDVSIQSQILNLIADLRARLNLAMIFISHDLSVIRHVSDRIAVMYLGKIVEIGPAADVFDRPAHPYTSALVAAIPRLGGSQMRDRQALAGDLPDPANPPPGCAFSSRCPQVFAPCSQTSPDLRFAENDEARHVACHLFSPAGR